MPKWLETATEAVSEIKTAAAKPMKRGDVSLEHNLYNAIGSSLLSGLERGGIDDKSGKDFLRNLNATLGIDMGGGFGVELGYRGADDRDQFRLNVSKKF